MNNEKIIHLISPFLFHTGSWIYSQIKEMTDFDNYVFTRWRENEDQFPYNKVFSFSDFIFYKKLLDKIKRNLLGDNYGLFFDQFYELISPKLFHAHFGFEAVRWLNFVKKNLYH